jgi:hypothetical protein
MICRELKGFPSKTVAGLALAMLFGGCTTIPPDERDAVRVGLQQDADVILREVRVQQPDIDVLIEKSAGYFVGNIAGVKAPLIAGSEGLGILIDRQTGQMTYLNLDRFDLGLGLGAQSKRGVVIFYDKDLFQSVKRGRWVVNSGTEYSVGTRGGEARMMEQGYSVHIASTEGVALTATVGTVRLSVNSELTDNGVADIGIPNRPQRPAEDATPRDWNRTLPFLGQRVVDKGYSLPLPWGITLIYADIEQDQTLEDLAISVRGGDKIPISDIVNFDEAGSDTQTIQAKLDAWLFPFLNIFGSVGYVGGDAPLLITVDGDVLPPIFGDPSVTFPIEAKVSGYTYSVGALLAGGWNGWFGTVPVSFTYNDIDGKSSQGYITTFSPRAGRIVPLGRRGNMAIYGGVQVMYGETEVDGSYTFPNENVTLDYSVTQSIKDPLNVVVGFNWSFTRRVSWGLEYGGFTGSRESILTMLGWRF